MIGPVLNAIYDWLIVENEIEDCDNPVSDDRNVNIVQNGLENLVKMFDLGAWFGSVGIDKDTTGKNDLSISPIDNCTGVVIHLFVDSPQVVVIFINQVLFYYELIGYC